MWLAESAGVERPRQEGGVYGRERRAGIVDDEAERRWRGAEAVGKEDEEDGGDEGEMPRRARHHRRGRRCVECPRETRPSLLLRESDPLHLR